MTNEDHTGPGGDGPVMFDHDDEVWFRSPEPLGWPFAVLGGVLGYFSPDFGMTGHYVADRLCLQGVREVLFDIGGVDVGWRVVIAALFAVSFAIGGRWVAGRISMGAPPLRSASGAMLAAALCGVCVLFMLTLARAGGPIVRLGFLIAALATPLALWMTRNAAWAWRARGGSVLHRVYRRARWIDLATGLVVLLALYANPMFGERHDVGGRDRVLLTMAIVFVASSVAVVMMVSGASSLRRLGKIRARFGAASGDGEAARERGAEVVDLGIGEERRHDVRAAASAYRHQDRVEAVCVGDLKRAWRVLAFAAARALLVVVIGAVVMGARVRFGVPFADARCEPTPRFSAR